ncbi:MAG: ATP-binding cassette domain-containing protein [Dehalococcoidia bacterium]|nr:ATP-binding cassette domain-containing protein [Dehalococcoidia bacterium]
MHSIPVRLLGFLLPYKRRVAASALLVALSSGFVVVQPQVIAWAIDFGLDPTVEDGELVANGDTNLLWVAGVAIIAVAIIRSFFAYGQQYESEWIAQRIAYDIRNKIYDRLQSLSFAFHDEQSTGQLMSRATQDVEGIRLYIQMGVLRFAYVFLLLIFSAAVMFAVNWQLALVAWAFMPIIAWRSIVTTRKLRPIWLEIQAGMGRMGNVLQENLSGLRVVKAFGREEAEVAKFDAEARANFENSYEASRLQSFNAPLLTGLGMIAMVVTIWYGAVLIDRGSLSIGELTAFITYLTLLQLPVRSLGWMMMILARASSAGARVYEILDAESAVREKPDATPLSSVRGDVRFENVGFGYRAAAPVLRDISIDAPAGKVVALLGPTGSGKTTVVNLMPRFYDVTEGRITVDGRDIRDVTLESLRRSIGVVQQDLFLFWATIGENIAYGAESASREDIARAAKAARIHDFISGLPDGYDTWVGERGITLSGGQKQRISIARTLLIDPPILVLDDSTSSVDTETEYLIQEALAELMKGRTTFVVAQRLRTIKRAGEILVMKDGRIVERGRHDELLRGEGFYRQIYELELKDQEEAFEHDEASRRGRTAQMAAGGG